MIVDGADHGASILGPHVHRPFHVRDRRQRGGGPALGPARQAAEARHLRPVRTLRRRRGHRPRLPPGPPRSRRPRRVTSWTRSPRSSSAAPRLAGGVGKASGTLIGALILAVLRNGLNLLSVSAFWQQVVIGVVIALAVLLDTVRRKAGATPRRRRRRPVRPGPKGKQAAKYRDRRGVRGGDRRRPCPSCNNGSSGTTHQGRPVALHAQQPLLRADEGGRAGRGEEARASTSPSRTRRTTRRSRPTSCRTSPARACSSIIVNPVDSDAVGPAVRGRQQGATSRSSPPTAASTRRTRPRSSPPTTSRAAGSPRRRSPRSSAARARSSILQGTGGHLRQPRARPGLHRGPQGLPGHQGRRQAARGLRPHQGPRRHDEPAPGPPATSHGVFAENDEMALGAIKALGSKAGKSVARRRLRRHARRSEGGRGGHAVRLRRPAAEGTRQDRRAERGRGRATASRSTDGEGAGEGRHGEERRRASPADRPRATARQPH